jgi:transglutaminase-like putative cysteine protease
MDESICNKPLSRQRSVSRRVATFLRRAITQRVARDSSPARSPPPEKPPEPGLQASLTRKSEKASNRRKTTKKADVLQDAKRRLSEFTPASQFPNQTESCGRPAVFKLARDSSRWSTHSADYAVNIFQVFPVHGTGSYDAVPGWGWMITCWLEFYFGAHAGGRTA